MHVWQSACAGDVLVRYKNDLPWMLLENAAPHSLWVTLCYSLMWGVTRWWTLVQLKHSQCFPPDPLASNKVQQMQLRPSRLQLFVLRKGQSKSLSGLTGCRVKFHRSVHSCSQSGFKLVKCIKIINTVIFSSNCPLTLGEIITIQYFFNHVEIKWKINPQHLVQLYKQYGCS